MQNTAMPKRRKYLSRKQAHALSALLTAPTIADAASQVDVSVRTLYRWLKQPAFQSEMRFARRRALSYAIGRLQRASIRAADTLDKVMCEKTAAPSSRVSAARVALRFACYGAEIEDFEERLAAIEQTRATRNAPATRTPPPL
jgi:hypothetical protein